MQNSTSKAPSSPKKNNKIKEPKQLQPPKIHFEDKKGVVGKGGAEDVNDQEQEECTFWVVADLNQHLLL